MQTIFPNSPRAQAESEALLRSLELCVQLISTIRKKNLSIYQFRPSVNFIREEVSGNEQVKFSYAYKYHHISPVVYPVFTSTQMDSAEGIERAIKEIAKGLKATQDQQSLEPNQIVS
jgi:hypothetical protein